jgi:hypothetical protein
VPLASLAPSRPVPRPCRRRHRPDLRRRSCGSPRFACQGGAAPRRRGPSRHRAMPLRDRPARERLLARITTLIISASALTKYRRVAVSSPLDFPSRGHRVKGALRASLTRSAFADPGAGTRSTGAVSYEETGGDQGATHPPMAKPASGSCRRLACGQTMTAWSWIHHAGDRARRNLVRGPRPD